MNFKRPTAKQFKTLLISCADNSGYNDLELVTDYDKVAFLADTITAELPHLMQAGRVSQKQCSEWLRGLASACTVPFYNSDIIDWWCDCTGLSADSLSDDRCHDLVDEYWRSMAGALLVLITRYNSGYKKLV